jgi:hypothetical protein
VNDVRTQRPTGEILAVWVLFALEAAATLATYWRLPADELYRVSGSGFTAAAGRVLVLLNFPVALAAIAVVGVLLERGAPRLPAWLAIGLCALTPFAVDQNDLDARPVNALPALGVAIALALTVRMRPRTSLARRRELDGLRLVVGAVLAVIATPWYFAELGFYAPDPILADEVVRDGDETLAAVHLGFHHGMGGTLLAAAALLLSRVARSLPVRGAVALMLVYGAGNAVQDAWHEQVWKRGWTDFDVPPILLPSLSLQWALVVFAAAVLTLLSLRRPAAPAR